MWVSATQAETTFWPENRRNIGNVIVTFSNDCIVTTTYNTGVIITNEIDQYYSGVQVSS